jgi:hypothetical protein
MWDSDTENMTREELLNWNLIRAEAHAQQALDLLYQPYGPRRSLLYRLRLGRAQNSLMVLVVRELAKRKVN